jgi:hypothetical protein
VGGGSLEENIMENTKRISESFKVLNNRAEQLLAGLYNMKYFANSDAIPYLDSVCQDNSGRKDNSRFTETAYSSIMKALSKKFPDYPDISKNQAYQSFVSDSKILQEELRAFYGCLSDISEFTDTAQSFLFLFEKLSGLNVPFHISFHLSTTV